MSQNEKKVIGRGENMSQEKLIMVKLAELLSRENLISPDEQARLVQTIKKGGEV